MFARFGALVLAAALAAPVVAWAETYTVENQWGGNAAPWRPGGSWTIGARPNQPVVAVNVRSTDNGRTLTGTMTYRGEGPIGFRGTSR